MKHFYLLLITIFTISIVKAQIVNIPDANFKNALLNANSGSQTTSSTDFEDVDLNNDGEIQVSEAEAMQSLNVSGQNISSLEGIGAFKNLVELIAENNQLTAIDITNFETTCDLYLSYNNFTTTTTIIGLKSGAGLFLSHNQLNSINTDSFPLFIDSIDCDNNQITTLDLSGLSNIVELNCSNNPLTDLILPEAPTYFNYFTCNYTNLTSLDLSNAPYLEYITCNNNSLLEFINLKNGTLYNSENISLNLYLANNPSLEYFCTGEDNIDYIQALVNNFSTECTVNSYCTFEPGGTLYTLQGTSIYDANNNGCDTNDGILSNLKINITQSIQTGSFMSDASGNYSFPVGNGMHTITPELENTSYFILSPSSITVNFPTETSPYIQDFCISPNGTHNDLEITILPLEEARPGFNTDYKLIYKNKGTTSLSGAINLIFQDDLMDLTSSTPVTNSQTVNSLNWEYTSLVPFESREILLTMSLNTPIDTPPINGDDILMFTANINSSENDETPADNTFILNQTVVNSFDPNDKTCLEGTNITPDFIGKYVHYLIRFENTGTANAINVVVKDILDSSKFDITSLLLVDASHIVNTRVNNNIAEFIFENINLSFDDATNDGYVVFKIKTLNTLVEGDVLENDAEIYFDYNFPIITNNYITSIESETLNVDEFNSQHFEVYPNPIKDVFTIKSIETINSINIYDISGRLVYTVSTLNDKEIIVNTTKLNTGAYFAKIKTVSTDIVIKLIKE